MRDRPSFAMIDALTSHALPKKRMMWVMNGHIFADMGRMTLQWELEEQIGSSLALIPARRPWRVP
ncbi:hypothetical protein CN090_25615 [Sinorhizobium meliloti]|nr:hypothetical protein CN167_30125 [Sinorhizobium medicae]RVN03890.1 hypothetical protein CN115_29425 [Sinorhizobium meliloti]RVN16296.1 hypothetical protein CN114_30020 [Sinorhizobium meliloti]RVN33571.1 hypothetical protein CN111_30150 [Sinorhizobium meliloti]RVN49846.1 hypothetical protein CN108_31090 [Sinorhizobium meliloti]